MIGHGRGESWSACNLASLIRKHYYDLHTLFTEKKQLACALLRFEDLSMPALVYLFIALAGDPGGRDSTWP